MQKMIFVSGPCVIESLEILRKIAHELQPVANDPRIDFYFKASFDKANRTSIDGFRGPGLECGMECLAEIKREFGYKILTDVHESCQILKVAEVADVLQIPAFLCRQTDLIIAAAKTSRKINIKKGQFMSPEDMKYSVEKVIHTRGGTGLSADYETSQKYGVFLCERGNSFGYGNLVVDMRGLKIMREIAPVIFDATHSVQAPGALKGKTGGDRTFAPILARAAAAVGVDGFFAECHFSPQSSPSDAANMLPTAEIPDFLAPLFDIAQILKNHKI